MLFDPLPVSNKQYISVNYINQHNYMKFRKSIEAKAS